MIRVVWEKHVAHVGSLSNFWRAIETGMDGNPLTWFSLMLVLVTTITTITFFCHKLSGTIHGSNHTGAVHQQDRAVNSTISWKETVRPTRKRCTSISLVRLLGETWKNKAMICLKTWWPFDQCDLTFDIFWSRKCLPGVLKPKLLLQIGEMMINHPTDSGQVLRQLLNIVKPPTISPTVTNSQTPSPSHAKRHKLAACHTRFRLPSFCALRSGLVHSGPDVW